jgi:hypothetical protein
VSVELKVMGPDKIRYFLFLEGRWRWRPTKAMRAAGFKMVSMGRGGAGLEANGNPKPSVEDCKRAIELNAQWDAVRLGTPLEVLQKAQGPLYPPGSVGHGYERAMVLREAERQKSGVVWTHEQASRDDWPRAWKWLEPKFNDCDPNTIQPEHFLHKDPVTGAVTGLIAEIEAAVSVSERHRVVKVWRALWKRMAAMKYCAEDGDPSKAVANTPPDPRKETWHRREVLKLVQAAWRHQFYGLAACMAVTWDSMLSPVDVRKLTAGQAVDDGAGIVFTLDRAKTGTAAAGTLSNWSQAILLAYLKKRFSDATLLENTPLFWTRGGRPVSRKGKTGQWGGDHGGGRHIAPKPYRKQTLADDFKTVRELAFGKLEKRQISDMRRSGAVEGDAGGASLADQSNKMANTVDANKRLRKTYNPVNTVSVRRFDEARAAGAKLLEQKTDESVRTPVLLTLLKNGAGAK